MNIERLVELNDKLTKGLATKSDKDEFMEMLYRDKKITPKQYEKYLKNGEGDEILQAALAIAAMLLFVWLLSELLSEK